MAAPQKRPAPSREAPPRPREAAPARPLPPRAPARAEPRPAPPPPPPAAPRELGWFPDAVFTGEKFETGVAFFADALGRITRFSREPADLAMARRLPGQAALPGLINAHSHSYQRTLRGRAEQRGRPGADPRLGWREAHDAVVGRLTPDDVFETARMAFMEMLLAGITCVGEFHMLHRQPDGSAYDEPGALGAAIMRAAHEVGIRLALLPAAWLRGGFGTSAGAPARFAHGSAEEFIRICDALRTVAARDYPADEVWVGAAFQSLAAVPLDACKAVAAYAHAQRMRLHAHVSAAAADLASCRAEYGRSPVMLLAEHGVLDKRFAAVDAIGLGDDEAGALGAARATVVLSPASEQNFGLELAPVEKLVAAGAGLALGTDSAIETDLLRAARSLEYRLRSTRGGRAVFAADPAAALLHAATVTGARSLGATGGALEVGRPADFFTINLYDPSIAGGEPDALLGQVIFALERRAIREVWIGARQRVVGGRHPNQGPIVGRFVDLQRRLWAGA